MRLWHLIFAVFLTALCLAFCRDEVGRVALTIFVTGLCLIFLATSSLMLLFRTFGALGMARSWLGQIEALAATIGVLCFGSASMWAVLWCGLAVVQKVVK
ncbi:MAG: hypothetical protein JWN86_2799 [Planctomycetota bacterium]|nr:hypothetical protein [Planctomycetota bacterium]